VPPASVGGSRWLKTSIPQQNKKSLKRGKLRGDTRMYHMDSLKLNSNQGDISL